MSQNQTTNISLLSSGGTKQLINASLGTWRTIYTHSFITLLPKPLTWLLGETLCTLQCNRYHDMIAGFVSTMLF